MSRRTVGDKAERPDIFIRSGGDAEVSTDEAVMSALNKDAGNRMNREAD